jgi:hypothetical protein
MAGIPHAADHDTPGMQADADGQWAAVGRHGLSDLQLKLPLDGQGRQHRTPRVIFMHRGGAK